ncbi:hybrid sensor histidine kinase/response regulator [Sanyastnella coralliicola]|uniref:hybrid sensor histidine kinase/response regulator n=1 Tax=Sanyastnella coralliicola TaxID=3069118 RepID=UPI0027B9508E|nr:ATP-binding protein [Longitalea sp. SCSIO 12813]
MKHSLLILLALLSASLQTNAQYAAHVLNNKDGLENELVKCTVIDSLGFVWAATDGGLTRFNGTSFSNFAEEFGTPYLKWIHQSSNGEVYISCDAGIFKADYTQTEVTINKLINGVTEFSDGATTFPKSMYEASTGDLWVGDDFGVGRISNGTWRVYYLGKTNSPDCFQRAVSFAEMNGHLYAFTHAGTMLRYDEIHDDFIALELDHKLTRINTAVRLDNQYILLGTDDGLVYFDPARKTLDFNRDVNNISWIDNSDPNEILIATWRNGMYQLDAEGNVSAITINNGGVGSINHIHRDGDSFWISSDNGMIFCEKQTFSAIASPLNPGYTQDLAFLPEGNVIAHEHELIQFNEEHKGEIIYQHDDIIIQVVAFGGTLRFSDASGYVYDYNEGEIKLVHDWSNRGGSVFFMMVDKEKNVWYTQSHREELIKENPEGRLSVFNSGNGIISPVTSIRQNDQGEIYACGEGDASFLYKYEPALNRFINLTVGMSFDYNNNLGVNDIAFTDSLSYLATDFGLYTFDGLNFEKVDLGLLTNEDIKAISTTNEAVWFGLSAGLVRYDANGFNIFDSRQGLPTKTLSYRGLEAFGNELWIGTANGLAHLAEDTPPQKTSSPVLTGLSVNGATAEIKPTVTVYSDDLVRVDFTTSEFPVDQISYRWRVAGTEEWKTPDLGYGFLLNNLTEGPHEFEIQARKNGNYLWSEPCLLSIQSTTIWYKTAVFIEICVLLMLALFTYLVRSEKRRAREKELRLQLMVAERTSELENAKEEALASAHAKSEFLSTMSHEIRTPMNAVIGIAHLMLEEELNEDQRHKMESLRFSANNLLEILNDILDFNKIESGKLELERRVFGLRQFMRNLHTGMDTRARQKDIGLNYTIDERIPELVIGDSTRLSQIMVNLMSNAIKFTSKGSVDCHFEFLARENDKAHIRVSVKDTGIGIPLEKQQDIFKSFTQANSSTTREFGGTGLGLTIVKSLLEIMGSQIQLKSTPGEGTTFFFELWMDIQDGKIFETGPQGNAKEILQGLRVLVAEDNEMNIMVASSFLKLWNVEFTIARNGQEAVDLHMEQQFDVILMDLQMPIMDGVTATQTIRNRERLSGAYTPIIALTASALTQSREKVMAAGMDNFVTKPFRPQELLQALAQSKS